MRVTRAYRARDVSLPAKYQRVVNVLSGELRKFPGIKSAPSASSLD